MKIFTYKDKDSWCYILPTLAITSNSPYEIQFTICFLKWRLVIEFYK